MSQTTPTDMLLLPAEGQKVVPQGILLYYKYVPLQGNDAEEVARFYAEMCGQLDLKGRIRVARDGINVTVGGSMAALRAHATAVTEHPLLQGGDIDFKLAPSGGARNEVTRSETKMDRLVVRLCEELVTLGPLARHRADPLVSTAPHLSPEQFHEVLERAAAATATTTAAASAPLCTTQPAEAETAADVASAAGAAPPPGSQEVEGDEACRQSQGPLGGVSPDISKAAGADPAVAEGTAKGVGGSAAGAGNGAASCGGGGGAPEPHGQVVLLDARNIYETRIGHFDVCSQVQTLDPRTRCFSDLPAWLDAHEALLRNRTVLMYCTGGVRCERASAYLREKGSEFSRVFQLSGGIQRYLERFPDGGFFRGKNFLYDDRIAVGPQDVRQATPGAVVGRCLLCGRAWDDYGARLRCSHCRLLLLVCDGCNAALHGDPFQKEQQLQPQPPPPRHPQQQQTAATVGEGSEASAPAPSADISTSPLAPELRLSPSCGTAEGQLTRGSQRHLLCELCSAATASPGGAGGPVDSGAVHAQVDAPTGSTSGTRDDGNGGQREVAVAAGNGSTQVASATAGACPATTTTITTTDTTTTSFSDPDGGAGVAQPGGGQRSGTCKEEQRLQHAAAVPPATDGAGGFAGAGISTAVNGVPRRLRILCLHGFRQTGKQFLGRTCALRKKLRDLADFVFVDAPHLLPFFVKAPATGGEGDRDGGDQIDTAAARDVGGAPDADARGDVHDGASDGDGGDGGCGARDAEGRAAEQEQGAAIAAVPQDEFAAAAVGDSGLQAFEVDGESVAVHQRQAPPPPPPPPVAAKRAWLLPPELYGGAVASDADAPPVDNWQEAPSYVDELQYMRQTEGWPESVAAVQAAVRQMGPFDGVFGFSQGASVAAVLCTLQQQHRHRQHRPPQQPQQDAFVDQQQKSAAQQLSGDQDRMALGTAAAAPCPAGSTEDPLLSGRAAQQAPGDGSETVYDSTEYDFGFRFAILASGFPSPLLQHRALMAEVGPLELPSLHVYGSGGGGGGGAGAADRQIPPRQSEALAAAFSCEGGRRRSLCHQCGHLIPATKSHAATFRGFLSQFL